jgi:hypothetical protein
VYQALRAASVTMRGVLEDHLAADPDLGSLFVAGGGALQVTLETPDAMRSASIFGLSLWLYRIVQDDQLRNRLATCVAPGREQAPPLPLRAHYLLTPIIANDTTTAGGGPEREQTLLGRAMQFFHGHPILRGQDLRDLLAGTDSELTARLEPMTLEEITRVWAAVRQPYQLSVSYEVTCALIGRDEAPTAFAPVVQAGLEASVIVGASP